MAKKLDIMAIIEKRKPSNAPSLPPSLPEEDNLDLEADSILTICIENNVYDKYDNDENIDDHHDDKIPC